MVYTKRPKKLLCSSRGVQMKCITILILLFFFMPSSLCAEIIGTKEDELFHRIIVNLNNECEDRKLSDTEIKIVNQCIALNIPLWWVGEIITFHNKKRIERKLLFSDGGMRGRLFLLTDNLFSSPDETALLVFSFQSPPTIELCTFQNGVLKKCQSKDNGDTLYDYVITRLLILSLRTYRIEGYYTHSGEKACFILNVDLNDASWSVTSCRKTNDENKRNIQKIFPSSCSGKM